MNNDKIAILKFNLDTLEGKESLNRALKADAAFSAIRTIGEQVFRKYRKYGLTEEMEQLDKDELVSFLEKEFYTVLEDFEVNKDS